MKSIRLTLHVVPRTKKTHGRIIGRGRKCNVCGKHQTQLMLPSETFEEFEKAALLEGSRAVSALIAKGAQLPITEPVSIKATFYRDRETGDWTGFTNALADVLQGELYSIDCPACGRGKRIGSDIIRQGRFTLDCLGCGRKWVGNAIQAKLARRGIGIIADDSLIVHWDGTRLLKDSRSPRIEIEISVIEAAQTAMLFGGGQ